MSRKKIPAVHPGEILLEEFMKPMGISQNELAWALRVPPRRINEIVHAKRGITVDSALRLSRHFGTSVRFWLGLQDDYDLDVAEDSQVVEKINREVAPRVGGYKVGDEMRNSLGDAVRFAHHIRRRLLYPFSQSQNKPGHSGNQANDMLCHCSLVP